MKKSLFILTAVMALAIPARAKSPKGPPPEPATSADFQKAFASTETVVLHNIVFGPGRATITEASRSVLDEIKKLMDAEPDLKLSIEVHTDSSGKASANLELSKRRAMALREALIKRGVDAKRLYWQGYGAERPIDAGATKAAKAKNRRVELVKK